MASMNSFNFYPKMSDMSPVRAIAETVILNPKVRQVCIAEAYDLALSQPGVSRTDIKIYPPLAQRYGLPDGAKVLNDCHGKIVGRTAKARVFYRRVASGVQRKVEGDLREAVYQLEHHKLIKAEAVLGLDKDLMIKATFVSTESDACNMFNWLCNFTPFEYMREEYRTSKLLDILDIIIVGFNEWSCNDPFYNNVGSPQLALVDEKHNVIFNLGMLYFGERKKGTLTLAWTSGMRLGMAACHGGIKEIDFTSCKEEKNHKLGKRSIAFYGLSGTGKSSHTNSPDNNATLPEGFGKVVLHDDAFQIDLEEKVCRVWEPSLFDKTDSRNFNSPDWKYCISVMNHALVCRDKKILPIGLDIRQDNGRALFDRDLLGQWVNKCSFPTAIVWLMKDNSLPPIIKCKSVELAVAMGATLMTKRNRAENVKEEELNKLVFEPFANPFRVYELHKDIVAFNNVLELGVSCYTFNSSRYWISSDEDTAPIKLQTSLTLQTAVLMDKLEWEDWSVIPGAMIPTRASVDKVLPGYYDMYNPATRKNMHDYLTVLRDRFKQRQEYLKASDVSTKPELLAELVQALELNV
jgi:phosphoenolpyruvate carboxykinase (ATP)